MCAASPTLRTRFWFRHATEPLAGMNRARRLFVYALLFSLSMHLLFLAVGGFGGKAREDAMPLPIEASLAPAPPRPETRVAPKVRRMPEPVPNGSAPVMVAAEGMTDAVAEPVAESMIPEPPSPPPEIHVAAAYESAPAPAMPELDAGKPEPALALRALPESLTLRYVVRAGDEGFNLGEAVYSWRSHNGQYRLLSSAEASGLAALFINGKLVQQSEGALTPDGLRPVSYWLERNEQRKDTVRFDWARRRLTQGDSEVELPAGAQDLLSFSFHLALTVDASTPEMRLWVSNGRKLREYVFRRLENERLQLGKAEVDTLHLRGESAGEDRLDVWLAPSRQWLPLRIRTLDSKGKVMLLSLEAIS